MKLWSINRVLRWSGFRVHVNVSQHIQRPTLVVDDLVQALCMSVMLKHTHDEELGPIARQDLRRRFCAVLTTEREPTVIGVMWVGLPGSKGWAKWEPHNPAPIRSLLQGKKS